jgi:acyl-CoA reductase-like NAD-dependent aldehyde dehydrogenase
MSAWIEEDDLGRRWLRCFDPRDGSPGESLPCTSAGEIGAQLEAARRAQTQWGSLPLGERRRVVQVWVDRFLARAAEGVGILQQEVGRPEGEIWPSEIVANQGLFKYWLGHIEELLNPWPLSLSILEYPGKSGRVELVAKGVIALITPWNLPIAIPLRTLVPALLSGNAVLFKPSEQTPRIGAWLVDLAQGLFPDGLFSLVQGGAREGELLVRAPVDHIVFTGSVATGRAIGRIAAETGVSVSLELGGKDATIVLPDAKLERAAAGIAWGAFAFTGQNCAAVERCYVHRSVAGPFLEQVLSIAKGLRLGPDIGPLVTAAQRNKVEAQVRAAEAAGGRILCGGQVPDRPGFWYPPTVMVDVPEDSALIQEETFGPVLPVTVIDSEDQAVTLANASIFGLTASVWTADAARGEALGRRLKTGVFTVNNHGFTGALPDGAWTGPGDTGGGVTSSRFGLFSLTRPRTVVVDQAPGRELWWYPYNQALVNTTRGLVDLTRRGGPRLQALQSAVSGLINRWKDVK